MERIQLRRDLAAKWAEINPILMEGEVGFEIDTKLRKIGDGRTAWNNLDYLAAENVVQELGDSTTAAISQKTVNELIYRRFLSDSSFSNIPNIDHNHLGNINSKGAYTGYIETANYDTAWVKIFKNSGTLAISGVVLTRVLYFNSLDPTDINSFISSNNSYNSTIPTTARLALITLAKINNSSYSSINVVQDGSGVINSDAVKVQSIKETIGSSGTNTISQKAVRDISTIVNKDFSISGYLLSNTTGLPLAYDNYKITPFIQLNKEVPIILTGNDSTLSSKIWFYDVDYNPISTLYSGKIKLFTDFVVNITDFPSNAVYFRCSANITTEAYVFNSNISLIENKLNTFIKKEGTIISDLEKYSPRYLQKVVGKNLINTNDLLYGYSYSASTGFIETEDGILSNKLYLSPGTYSIQGIKPYNPLSVRILWFNDSDELVRADAITIDENLKGTYKVTCSNAFFYVNYARIVLQFNSTYLFYPNKAQFEFGQTCTDFEFCKTRLVTNPIYNYEPKFAFLTGASNAMPGNGWFEHACRKLGYRCKNVAISGENPMNACDKIWRGILYTKEELENIDFFVLSHTHNYNIAYTSDTSTILQKTVEDYEAKGYDDSGLPISGIPNPSNPQHHILPQTGGSAHGYYPQNDILNERYAAGFDYLIKKYTLDCYNLRLDPTSKWYGTKSGKPCNVIICSYWHDGYTVYNEAAKTVALKHGAIYCDIASKVGFSYRQTDPTDENSIRQSFLYCNNAAFGSGNDSEDIPINGVIYTNMGWHATRDVNSPLTVKRGDILANTFINYNS